MNIHVFHYHLLPGGVTDVIVHSLQAVVDHRDDVDSVRLVCGRAENTREVCRRLEGLDVPVHVSVVPGLDYTPANEPAKEAVSRSRELESLLMSEFGAQDSLWWVHNYHVGKNPAFTLALCSISRKPGHPPVILHIHDFPENARYENLHYLTRVTGESPYPSSPSVSYAVINARDLAAMKKAGVPDDRVHLLVNPLPPAENDESAGRSRDNLVNALSQFASSTHQSFNPEKPLLLYPIRAIRRKNILELGLFARLAGDWNLLTTLPGLSESESDYSRMISAAYISGAIPGVFGIGRRESDFGTSFAELTTQSDMIVSSSVQEGFGMLFINALRWRKPLFARDLPVLDGVRRVFESYPAHFYDSLQVPLVSLRTKADIRARYERRLEAVRELMPQSARTRILEQLEQVLSGPQIDFGYLPADHQLDVLNRISDEGFAGDVRALNGNTLAALETLQTSACPDVAARVDSQFGFAAFARSFDELLGTFGESAPSGRFGGVQQKLVDHFADLDRFRLILAPLSSTETE